MLPLARLLLIIPRRLLLSPAHFTFGVSAATAWSIQCERVALAVSVTVLTYVCTSPQAVIGNEILITIKTGLVS